MRPSLQIILSIYMLLCVHNALHAQRVCINELMQSNVDCLMVDNDFPDSWIELYNGESVEVSLAGWTIAKDSASTYVLGREAIIPAGGHLLICCDKQGKGLHTSFRLESGKGEVMLFNKDGELRDRIQHPKMPAPNVAYGQLEDQDGEWGYQLKPTPGAPNGGGVSDLLAPDPIFSLEGQLLDAPVTLLISMPQEDLPEGAELYWTLDGREPDASSSHGQQAQLAIDRTTVVRAKILAPDALCRRSVSQSYIFLPRPTDLPVVSILTDEEFLFGEEYGILAGSKDDANANYWKNWRRPINVQYLTCDPDGSDIAINQLAETAVGGATSRAWSQKSLKIYAHKRFGKKHLKGHLWHDKQGVGQCKSLMLRNGGSRNDGGMLHDAFAQRLFGIHVPELDWQAYEPVICYINGTYRGVYELRERSNEDYVEANYGYEGIVCNDSYYRGEEQWIQLREAVEGGASFDEIAERIDLDNFTAYLAAEAFTANGDWPANNVFVWKPDTLGGRWRNILKDVDSFSYYATPKNYLNFVFMQGSEATNEWNNENYLHHSLLCALNEHEEFRTRFICRTAVYLGDFLKPSVSLPMFEAMAARIEPELAATKEAWGGRPVLSWVYHEWDSIRSYLHVRPRDLYEELDEFYGLGGIVPLTIATYGQDIKVCGIPLTEGDFDGYWFGDLSLEAEKPETDCSWQITAIREDGSEERHIVDSPQLSFKPSEYGPTLQQIHLEAINPLSIQLVHDHSRPSAVRYDLFGRPSRATNGLTIRNGRIEFCR